MHYIIKKYTLPIGHRLMNHKGKCQYIHGHNFSFLIKINCQCLNCDGMVVDFSIVNKWFNSITELLDHALLLNEYDPLYTPNDFANVISIGGEPTAENLARFVFDRMAEQIKKFQHEIGNAQGLYVDSVEVFENETSVAGYTR